MNQPNNVLRKVDFDIPSDTSGAAALTFAPILLSDRPHLSFFIGYNVTGCETKYVDGWSPSLPFPTPNHKAPIYPALPLHC